MRKFLYFLGSAVYGAAAAYITYIFFKWFYGFTWRLAERLVGRALLYFIVLLACTFVVYVVVVYLSTVVAFPLKLMRGETSLVRYVPTLLFLAAGYGAGRLPWLVPMNLYTIGYGVLYIFIIANFYLNLILFTWKRTEDIRTSAKSK